MVSFQRNQVVSLSGFSSYHQGQLFLIPHQATPWLPVDLSTPIQYKWRFASQTGKVEELVDDFEDVLVAWYQ